jgi:hypothetical protein
VHENSLLIFRLLQSDSWEEPGAVSMKTNTKKNQLFYEMLLNITAEMAGTDCRQR